MRNPVYNFLQLRDNETQKIQTLNLNEWKDLQALNDKVASKGFRRFEAQIEQDELLEALETYGFTIIETHIIYTVR